MKYILSVCIIFFCAKSLAQESNLQLKAQFIARFVQFIQWPPPPAAEFVYCIAADETMLKAFHQVKLVGANQQAFKILSINTPENAKDCHVLYLKSSDKAELQQWQERLLQAPILVISDNSEAFRQLAIIVLVSGPDKMSFRINKTLADSRGLVLSSQLLKLAQEVR